MRLCSPVLAMFLVVTGSLVAGAQELDPSPTPPKPPAAPTEVEDGKIRKLLVERRKTLEDLLAVTKASYDAGKESITAVFEVQKSLVEASLELAEDHAERMKIHQERVDLLIEMERHIYAYVQAGRMPTASYPKVKAERLLAEVEMLREQKRR